MKFHDNLLNEIASQRIKVFEATNENDSPKY